MLLAGKQKRNDSKNNFLFPISSEDRKGMSFPFIVSDCLYVQTNNNRMRLQEQLSGCVHFYAYRQPCTGDDDLSILRKSKKRHLWTSSLFWRITSKVEGRSLFFWRGESKVEGRSLFFWRGKSKVESLPHLLGGFKQLWKVSRICWEGLNSCGKSLAFVGRVQTVVESLSHLLGGFKQLWKVSRICWEGSNSCGKSPSIFQQRQKDIFRFVSVYGQRYSRPALYENNLVNSLIIKK